MSHKGFRGMEAAMNHQVITASAILLSGITALLYAQNTNLPYLVMIPDNGDTDSTNAVKSAEALLYLVPKGQFETQGWGTIDLQREAAGDEQDREIKTGTRIYRIEEFEMADEAPPFSEIFGPDWIIVKAADNDSLYKLIAANAPEDSVSLPPIRIDSSKYKLEELLTEPSWPEGSVPRQILLKWAEWWQNETNATPVVLILLNF